MPSDDPRRFLRDLLVGSAGPGARRDWEAVEGLLRLHGLEGLAVSRHRESDGALLPPGVLRRLEPGYRRTALWTTLLVEAGVRAREALGAAGVPSLLFKGAALVAGGQYADPGARRMDDADLLVPSARADDAVAALGGAGFRPWKPWDPRSTGWLDSASFVDPASPPGLPVSLDLHWRLGYGRLRFGGPPGPGPSGVAGPFPRSPGAESRLWTGADPERGLPAAGPHLVSVAEHLLKHLRFHVHLQALGDVVRLAHAVGDWDEVGRLARASPLAPGIGHLLAGLAAESPLPIPRGIPLSLVEGAPLAASLGTRLRPSALVGSAGAPPGSRVRGVLLRWRILGSPGAVARDLADAAFPDGRWLRARYGSGGGAVRLRMLYAADVLRWITHRGRSPASPNQDLLS